MKTIGNMKKLIIILVLSLPFIQGTGAQDTVKTELNVYGNLENVISEIEENNTTLQALRKQLEARRLGNRTGIFLPDPEAQFNYLWGDPSIIGNRINLALTQSFDFPTAYKYRRQISDDRNDQLNLEYNSRLRDIRFQARLVLTDLVYYNNMKAEYQRRLALAGEIASSFKARLDEGESGLPDYNKAQLNLLNVEKELENIRIEREVLLSELASLNGGQEVSVAGTGYEDRPLPDDFSQWYREAEKENPMLQWLTMEIGISSKQEKLNAALALPSFHAGYMSESVGGESFRGIAAGITVPLWENRNMIKTARAQTQAIQEEEEDKKLQFYHHLQAQYEKAVSLKKSLEAYRQRLDLYDNTIMLKKALDLGQISLAEYIVELSIYFESIDSLLEWEREFQTAVAHLYRYY